MQGFCLCSFHHLLNAVGDAASALGNAVKKVWKSIFG